ncbi:MAG: pyridoxal phosphate-dependent decarboxylase family protein [Prochlorotrichaceae cyanobacterium]
MILCILILCLVTTHYLAAILLTKKRSPPYNYAESPISHPKGMRFPVKMINRSSLPLSAFVHPDGENQAAVMQVAQQVLALLFNHLKTAHQRSPLPPISRLKELPISVSIPDESLGEDSLFAQLKVILTHSMNAANPAFIGHMDSMPTTFSLLGELISAGLNNNMLSLEMSPLLTQLETHLLQDIATLFGFPKSSIGVMLSGGTLANLQALAVARNLHFNTRTIGLTSLNQPPVLFASDVAHTSLQKAAMLLGLGTASVISIPTNSNSQMETEALRSSILLAQDRGQIPFCIVATAGTTTTGNIDPLLEISQIARDYKLWFHVDAAYGGALVFSPDQRHRLAGIENADSITFNPQKWLYVAKTCAMVLFKDPTTIAEAFRIPIPYMSDRDDFINLGEISIQGTRHAEVLKLWLSLQHIGKTGYAQLIHDSYTLTAYFVQQIQKRSFLELASEPETNLICFRGWFAHQSNAEIDRWNTELQAHLLQHSQIFLSLPTYRGSRWLRAVLLNPYTATETIDQLFQAIDRFHYAANLRH